MCRYRIDVFTSTSGDRLIYDIGASHTYIEVGGVGDSGIMHGVWRMRCAVRFVRIAVRCVRFVKFAMRCVLKVVMLNSYEVCCEVCEVCYEVCVKSCNV